MIPLRLCAKLTCPVLVLNGEKIYRRCLRQPARHPQGAVMRVVTGITRLMSYPASTIFFQPATTGLPAEYAEIEVTMSPIALDRIADCEPKQ